MKLTSSNRPEFKHEIIFVYRDNEVIIAAPDGKEIATIKTETMMNDVKGEDGSWKSVPTKSFWVSFSAKEHTGDKYAAGVVNVDGEVG